MDRKKLVLLVGALIVAIGTALMAKSMFSGASAPQAEAAAVEAQGPKVLVAQRALPTGTIITADSIGFQLWPKELVQDAYFLDGEADITKLIGTVVRHPITAGEPITQGSLVSPGDRGFLAAALQPGMRAITVPVTAQTGVAGFIFPGDRVDVMLTQTVGGNDGTELKASETILRNIRVLATDQSTVQQTGEKGETIVAPFKTVTLEVTPKIAEKISVAQTIGTLSLSLRSLADNEGNVDDAVATSDVNIPDNASPAEEERLLRAAMASPQDGKGTFATGGDVSRFQRSSMPPQGKQGQNVDNGGSRQPGYGAPVVPVRTGPTVNVTRGKVTEEVPVASSARAAVASTARGTRAAGRTATAATPAMMAF